MAKVNKSILKSYFEAGDIPTQGQYANLIDSQFNLAETETQIIDGILSASSGKFEFMQFNKAYLPGIGIGDAKVGTTFAIGRTLEISGSVISNTGSFSFLSTGGDVSASGDLYGNNLNLSGNASASGFLSSSNIVTGLIQSYHSGVGTAAVGSTFNIGPALTVQGQITSSHITSDILYLNTLSERIDGSPSGLIINGNITSSGDISASGNLVINGNITSSGEISSSGTTRLEKLYLGAPSGLTISASGRNSFESIVFGSGQADGSNMFGNYLFEGTLRLQNHTFSDTYTSNADLEIFQNSSGHAYLKGPKNVNIILDKDNDDSDSQFIIAAGPIPPAVGDYYFVIGEGGTSRGITHYLPLSSSHGISSSNDLRIRHITSSGNISASGTASFGFLDTQTLTFTNITSSGDILFNTGSVGIRSAGDMVFTIEDLGNLGQTTNFEVKSGVSDSTIFKVDDQGFAYFYGGIVFGEGSDQTFTSDGNMTFMLDYDTDETDQKFEFKNSSTVLVKIDESANISGSGYISSMYDINAVEMVDGGNGVGNATALSTSTGISFVSTDTNENYVTLADGARGQIKHIIHKSRSNTVDLVIRPTNLKAGTTLTSNADGRGITLIFGATDWHILGDVGEFVIA